MFMKPLAAHQTHEARMSNRSALVAGMACGCLVIFLMAATIERSDSCAAGDPLDTGGFLGWDTTENGDGEQAKLKGSHGSSQRLTLEKPTPAPPPSLVREKGDDGQTHVHLRESKRFSGGAKKGKRQGNHQDEDSSTNRDDNSNEALFDPASFPTCEYVIAGPHEAVDDQGIQCHPMDMLNGCCTKNTTQPCATCKKESVCCERLTSCIACCVHPRNAKLRRLGQVRQSKLKLGGELQKDWVRQASPFQYCAARCRHSSSAVYHQNRYFSNLHHCFGPQGDPKLPQ